MDSPLSCLRCQAPLPDTLLNRTDLAPCPACGTPLQAEVFPALFRAVPRGHEGEPVMVEGEASCFYHPQKKATIPCEGCGRFLCALCDCELQGRHFCPTCLEAGKQKGRIKSLENQRTLYGNIALALALYPVVLLFGIYFTCITAPMAMYVAIRYWKAPASLVRPGRTLHVLAMVVALVEIGAWVALIALFSSRRMHG
jgi:hypothetical protein